MNIKSLLDKGMNQIMKAGGVDTTVNLISYTNIESSYDDDVQQLVTGSNVVSGLVFPVKATQGSESALLMQQGKLLTEDKLLLIGSCNISGNIIIELKTDEFYSIIPDGVQSWEINGSVVYQKFFIRRNLGGSMF